MGRTACTEPRCLYNGALYLYLYLYSPYGPYGLYRASVPVQGCTLPLPIPLLHLWAVRPVQSLGACTRVHFTFLLLNVLIRTPGVRVPQVGNHWSTALWCYQLFVSLILWLILYNACTVHILAPLLAHARPVDKPAAPKYVGVGVGAYWNRPPVLVPKL